MECSPCHLRPVQPGLPSQEEKLIPQFLPPGAVTSASCLAGLSVITGTPSHPVSPVSKHPFKKRSCVKDCVNFILFSHLTLTMILEARNYYSHLTGKKTQPQKG